VPAKGDLVVVLPDDEALLKDGLVYREQGQPLISPYRPRPTIPHWSYWLLGGFPLAAGDYNQSRPDRWMDASVTVEVSCD
jgi:hypothetical protein